MSFFDEHLVLYPWPDVLRRDNLKFLYKPREVWWKDWIDKMRFKPNEKVLEVGCGRGIFLDRLVAEFRIRASGVDISKKAIAEAKKESIATHNLKVADACELPFPDSFFNIVISFDTLEHIKEQEKAMSEMVRVLRSGGKILIYTINKNQRFTWDWLLDKIGIDVLSRPNHDPRLFVDPDWLKKELENQGVKILGLDYFNSFFTLAADEAIMVFLLIFNKFFDWEKTEKFGRMVLGGLTIFSIILTPILRILDLPWTSHGFSNGIIFLGIKK